MFAVIGRSIESIYQVCRGLFTVARHAARAPVTGSYPEELPETHFRGRLALTVNPETGEHLCISCRQCERVCPDKCIDITAHKSPETNKLELIDFKIDHGLCMYCGLCTEVCPTSCIINTNDFSFAEYSREALVYDLKRLTLTKEESAFYFAKQELPLPKPKKPAPPEPAAKPAGAAAASTEAGGTEPARTEAAGRQADAFAGKQGPAQGDKAGGGAAEAAGGPHAKLKDNGGGQDQGQGKRKAD